MVKELTNTSVLTFRCLSSRTAPSLALKGIYFRNLKTHIFLLTHIRLRKDIEINCSDSEHQSKENRELQRQRLLLANYMNFRLCGYLGFESIFKPLLPVLEGSV
jgi:hypothetical protein